MTDFVYLFGPSEFGLANATWVSVDQSDFGIPCKIGYTQNPKANLASLMRACPSGTYWHILWVPYQGRDLEKALHSVFSAFRCSREWFHLGQLDVSFIKSLTPDRVYSCHFGLSGNIAADLMEYRARLGLQPNPTEFVVTLHGTKTVNINCMAPYLATPEAA